MARIDELKANQPQNAGGSANSDTDATRLRSENARLQEQVRLLMAAESKLYTLQEHLNKQQLLYARLAEVSRVLNTLLSFDEIGSVLVHFAVYEFNFERSLLLLAKEREYRESFSSQTIQFEVVASEGYYDNDEKEHLSQLRLDESDLPLPQSTQDTGSLRVQSDDTDPFADTLRQHFLMNEFFVFQLLRKEEGRSGYFVVGNTREQARYQTRVEQKDSVTVPLTSLAQHASITLANVHSYLALERERARLDQMVAERTRELSEALDAANEAVRLKGEFLAKMSHELRTPLNSIVNVPAALVSDYQEVEVWYCTGCDAEFQSEDDETETPCPECDGRLEQRTVTVCEGDPAEHLRFLKLVKQQGDHLLHLVEDVLDFSRMESGRVSLNYENISVKQLIDDVQQTIRVSIKNEIRLVTYDYPDAEFCFSVDALKIKQVLINLINNSVKFTAHGGKIHVSAAALQENAIDRYVRFEVSDDGIGIAKEQQQIIFESFRQVDGSSTRAHGGAGLGLAISKQLVELHGGRIWVESTPGVGSRFFFEIPVHPAQRFPSSVPPASISSPQKRTPRAEDAACDYSVVVVDNDLAVLAVSRRILELHGCSVVTVSESSQAFDTVLETRPDILILDLHMPGQGGEAVFKQVRAERLLDNTLICLSTADHTEEDAVKALGAVWLPKPWNAQSLCQTLNTHMKQRISASAFESEG
ncbi:MAG: response regulator [Deltaproteobacteria bacterium]|nr:response regulator [Deltaproteobacteria bacterium]MBN2671863.1 response regulator [Deltaproteobacteria bacterium]